MIVRPVPTGIAFSPSQEQSRSPAHTVASQPPEQGLKTRQAILHVPAKPRPPTYSKAIRVARKTARSNLVQSAIARLSAKNLLTASLDQGTSGSLGRASHGPASEQVKDHHTSRVRKPGDDPARWSTPPHGRSRFVRLKPAQQNPPTSTLPEFL